MEFVFDFKGHLYTYDIYVHIYMYLAKYILKYLTKIMVLCNI